MIPSRAAKLGPRAQMAHDGGARMRADQLAKMPSRSPIILLTLCALFQQTTTLQQNPRSFSPSQRSGPRHGRTRRCGDRWH